MRKKIVLFLFLTILVCANAQQVRFMNVYRQEEFTPQHDFRLGIGAVLFEDFEMSDSYCEPVQYDKIIDFNSPTTYRGMVFTNGIISANYTFQANSWFGIGVSASYVSFYNQIYDAESNLKVGSGIRNRISIYPLARLTWLRVSNTKFYSEIGLGLGATTDSETIYGSNMLTLNRFVSGQFTLLGISFGKKLYMYSNIIGAGNGGYFGLGMGYNFDIKKTVH